MPSPSSPYAPKTLGRARQRCDGPERPEQPSRPVQGRDQRSTVAPRPGARPEVERAAGIEPACAAWKAAVLPLNYARPRSWPHASAARRDRVANENPPPTSLARFAPAELSSPGAQTRRFGQSQPAVQSASSSVSQQFSQPAVQPAGSSVGQQPGSAESGSRRPIPRGPEGPAAGPEGPPEIWGKQDSNLRRLSQQIYSLSPLAAREFPHPEVGAPSPRPRWGSELAGAITHAATDGAGMRGSCARSHGDGCKRIGAPGQRPSRT